MKITKLTSKVTWFTKKSDAGEDVGLRQELIRRADAARDQQRYVLAASLYELSLGIGKPQPDILLQCGHMHKEAKNFPAAKTHYLEALRLQPTNAEILFQLGHFYKIISHYTEARDYYQQALIARPNWDTAQAELDHLENSEELKREWERTRFAAKAPTFIDQESADSAVVNRLINPDLFAKTREQLYVDHQEAFVFTRNGNDQQTKWGNGPTVRGVDCLRGYIVSHIPYLTIEIFLDGELIYKNRLVVAPQRRERSNPNIKKYVYNAWIDFTGVSYGWHDLVFRAINVRGDTREGVDWQRERIIVAEPLLTDAFAHCDGIIPPLDPASPLSVVEQINARPSIIHRASPCSFPGEIKNVVVIRADQLGDMVVSVPALLRLRELLPDARITGLLSRANEELGRSLKIFDEIIVLNFPDDSAQRQRIMERDEQERLMQQLAPYKFDLAIDFPVSGVSYKLLPLTGAPVTMGYGGDGRKILDLSLSTHDPKTNNDIMRHSARTRAMTEMLGLWLNSGAKIVRRDDLDRDVLEQYGVTEPDFIVLHSGSRIKFTQWPYYTELAARVATDLGRQVIFMAENSTQRSKLPPALLDSGKIIYMNQSLPFDHFDTFLSFCSVFVGNDSGPKHLASLRGAQVVSLHSSRIGWNEWGQEHTGVVISRQVPCAGCSLHHDPEECAQNVACITQITVDEVFREVAALLG